MKKCKICGEGKAAEILGVCIDCIRKNQAKALFFSKKAHEKVRIKYGLSTKPPNNKTGVSCKLCSNECKPGEEQISYCGLKENNHGRLKSRVSSKQALMHYYIDTLPTNCCASWFCPGKFHPGKVNIATFFYGCNFDCLFCQNPTHKEFNNIEPVSIDDYVEYIISRDDIHCICFFGGSPEPQFTFGIKAAEKILKKKNIAICWEWNGCGNREFVKKAAEISKKSNGIIKFDLKAYNPELSVALSGISNERAYENFKEITNNYFSNSHPPVLTATTLLIPYYVDEKEVDKISSFIGSLNPDIPYSLLVFHPDFYMNDLPITPREQVLKCYNTAKEHLNNVHIGNKHLIMGL